jgi:hypothetical protein
MYTEFEMFADPNLQNDDDNEKIDNKKLGAFLTLLKTQLIQANIINQHLESTIEALEWK